jgi:hypothetical protein
MSDRRHETLVKAAEECIDLMNIGADPDAALRQVKKAFDMNDNEVVLVSHAVNNSKQLANLQNGGKDKGAPFPLTNADSATGANSDADLDTLGANTKAKEEQPDAVEIADKVKKEASADSYVTKGSYRKVAIATSDMVADLQAAWGKAGPAMDVTDLGNPYDSVNAIKIAAEQARTEASRLRDQACANLDAVAHAFTVSGGPSFAAFEKAAAATGITSEIVDIIYDLGPAALEQPRNLDKTASDRLFVTSEILGLLKIAETADTQWQQSSDYEAARMHLLDQIHTEEVKLADAMEILENLSSSSSGSGEAARGLLPLDPTNIAELSKAQPTSEADSANAIGYKTMQQLHNSKARTQLQSLMQDEFVGKHTVPEVAEAFNRAISVNPNFGDAEVTAFVRQDLASKNAMPLDLMIRASNAHQKKDQGAA